MTNLKIFSTKVPSSMGLLLVCFLCHLTCPQCEVGQGSIGHSVENCSVFNWKYSALSLSLPFFKDQFCKWKSPSSVLYFVLILSSSQAHNGMNTKCTVSLSILFCFYLHTLLFDTSVLNLCMLYLLLQDEWSTILFFWHVDCASQRCMEYFVVCQCSSGNRMQVSL